MHRLASVPGAAARRSRARCAHARTASAPDRGARAPPRMHPASAVTIEDPCAPRRSGRRRDPSEHARPASRRRSRTCVRTSSWPTWASASMRSGRRQQEPRLADAAERRDALGRLERSDRLLGPAKPSARRPSAASAWADALRRPNSTSLARARWASAGTPPRCRAPPPYARAPPRPTQPRSAAASPRTARAPRCRRGSRFPSHRCGSPAPPEAEATAGGRAGSRPRAGSASGAIRHLARHVVILEPDERPGDAQRVRMAVRRAGRSGRCGESRVAGIAPAGHGAAHAQGDKVNELVLAGRKQRKGTLDLVDGHAPRGDRCGASTRGEATSPRGAVDLDQPLRMSRQRTMRAFEVAFAHAEVGLHEKEVGHCDRVGGELPRRGRMTSRACDVPGSMSSPCRVRQTLPTRFVDLGESRRRFERANSRCGCAARERSPRRFVELGREGLVRRVCSRSAMPDAAVRVRSTFARSEWAARRESSLSP